MKQLVFQRKMDNMDSTRYLQDALQIAQEFSTPLASVAGLTLGAILYQQRYDSQRTLPLVRQATAIAAEHGMLYWQTITHIIGGWSEIRESEIDENQAVDKIG